MTKPQYTNPVNTQLSSWDDLILRASKINESVDEAGIEFHEILLMLTSCTSISRVGLALCRIGQRIWNASIDWPDLERHETALRAKTFLESGLSLESSQGEMWRTLGELCHFLGEHSRAVEAFELYLEENPDHCISRAAMASSLHRTTRFARAYREARRVIEEADTSTEMGRSATEWAEQILGGRKE